MTTALLVIDPQRIYTESESEMYCEDSDATMDRINRLVRRFASDGRPIMICRHVHRSDGSDLGRMFDYLGDPEEDFNFKENNPEVEYDPRLVLPAQSSEFTKNRYSAFVGTPLKNLLQDYGVTRVVICGFMTNFCCESTARDAHDLDYFVDFVVDATGTPGTENLGEERIREIVAEFLEEGFARILTTEDALSQAY